MRIMRRVAYATKRNLTGQIFMQNIKQYRVHPNRLQWSTGPDVKHVCYQVEKTCNNISRIFSQVNLIIFNILIYKV